MFSQTAATAPISATTVETDLFNGGVGTLTVLANTLNAGDSFKVTMGGNISSANNQGLRIRTSLGGVIIEDSGFRDMVIHNNDVWILSMNYTIREIGGVGSASVYTLGEFSTIKAAGDVVTGFSFSESNDTTFSTTVDNILNITVEWETNNANNSINTETFVLNKTF
ncbi:hypothetical protein N9E79_00015 [bacterium]|nr:hypothetical protein [bacterium]